MNELPEMRRGDNQTRTDNRVLIKSQGSWDLQSSASSPSVDVHFTIDTIIAVGVDSTEVIKRTVVVRPT